MSSPYRRCTETVEPLADRLELTVRLQDELGTTASRDEVMSILLTAREHTLFCTHGEVITRTLPGITCEKGAVWILRRDASSFEPVLYLPPALARADVT